MMMSEIEVNIGGIVEERRLNTMKQINNEVEYVVQDNSDLENLQLLYEKLAYYAGMSDALEFLKE